MKKIKKGDIFIYNDNILVCKGRTYKKNVLEGKAEMIIGKEDANDYYPIITYDKDISKIYERQIRKQICDEIRERVRLLYHYQNNNGEKETVLTQTELFDVLQQIEKGDE